MDSYCLIGNPVAHSKSPWIHARFAVLTGQSLEYRRQLVPLGGFADAVRAFRASGGRGCNVTVPFKFEAAAFAGAALTPRAALAGACNTLRFEPDGKGLLADNTDGIGLVRDIEHNGGFRLAAARILLLGAGGAAAGVLGPLIEAGPAALTVANRTPAKADALVHAHQALAARHGVLLRPASLDDAGEGYDLVVNGTASSLAGAQVPVAGRVLRTGALACDMMYGPAAEPFLAWARAQGAQARDGLGMLVEQAAESFALWRGLRPPSAQVLAELRAAQEQPAA
ncbi:shikimate dehydrogenase [Ramlibacter sp. AN1015]|uniref:shikimate dehydrogenase n=1 Tax=Ramlibacter sp. AN1015 TaxID=3133428 RepID=UPI0030C24B57